MIVVPSRWITHLEENGQENECQNFVQYAQINYLTKKKKIKPYSLQPQKHYVVVRMKRQHLIQKLKIK